MFLLLSENQICVNGLTKVLGISESAVSQQLKILRNAGLIKGEKVGYFVHYNVQKNVLEELKGIINELSKDAVDLTEYKKALGIGFSIIRYVVSLPLIVLSSILIERMLKNDILHNRLGIQDIE